jgi:hypothetical protein
MKLVARIIKRVALLRNLWEVTVNNWAAADLTHSGKSTVALFECVFKYLEIITFYSPKSCFSSRNNLHNRRLQYYKKTPVNVVMVRFFVILPSQTPNL